MGVFFAFVAMAGWGVGDFLIQRSTRKFGNGITLFYITIFATVLLLPFIITEIPSLAHADYRFWLLMGASVIILLAGLLDFEALRLGKISVIEPVYAMEVPITVALGSLFLGEWLTPLQGALMAMLITGIIFVSLESLQVLHKFRLEKGVFLAAAATLGMSLANFLFGVGARHTSPLLINWFTSAFIALAMAAYLTYSNQWKSAYRHWRKNTKLILGVSLMDNLAWVAYTFSTLTIPIGIAAGISESYIALAALFGLVWNREKLVMHQKIGLACTILAAVALGILSGN